MLRRDYLNIEIDHVFLEFSLPETRARRDRIEPNPIARPCRDFLEQDYRYRAPTANPKIGVEICRGAAGPPSLDQDALFEVGRFHAEKSGHSNEQNATSTEPCSRPRYPALQIRAG